MVVALAGLRCIALLSTAVIIMGGFTVFINKDQYDFQPLGSPPCLILRSKGEHAVLDNRVFHHVIRSNGLCLPFTFVQDVGLPLLKLYLARKSYCEALDVAILVADIAIHKVSRQEEIIHVLQMVCEVVEAKGNFLHAAEVHLEMMTVFGATKNDEFYCLINDFFAFKRGLDFPRAEEIFLIALGFSHELIDHWRVMNESVQQILHSLMEVYYTMEETTAWIAITQVSDRKIVALGGLLYICGFQPCNDWGKIGVGFQYFAPKLPIR
jgi:hypothetical protein